MLAQYFLDKQFLFLSVPSLLSTAWKPINQLSHILSPIYLPWMVKVYQWYCIGVLVLNHATHKENLKRCSIFHLFYFFQEQFGHEGWDRLSKFILLILRPPMWDVWYVFDKSGKKNESNLRLRQKSNETNIRSSQLLAAANRYRGGGRDNESMNKWPLSRGNQSAVIDDELIQTCDLTWPSFNLLRTTWMSLDRPVPDGLTFPTD